MQIHLSGKLKHLGVPFHSDFALISPGLIPLLTKIEVVPEPFFDTHLVVILEFQMPDAPLKTLKFPMPKSFMELPLNLEFFPKDMMKPLPKKAYLPQSKLGVKQLNWLQIRHSDIPRCRMRISLLATRKDCRNLFKADANHAGRNNVLWNL